MRPFPARLGHYEALVRGQGTPGVGTHLDRVPGVSKTETLLPIPEIDFE